MGAIVVVHNLSQFQQLISAAGPKLVVVDFTATWCGPCRMIAPVFESLSERYAGRAVFLKVDVDEASDVSQYCSVSAMPTFHGYKNNLLVFQFSGADKNQLEYEVEKNALSSSEVAFSGAGNVLGGNTGAPKIDWDSDSKDNTGVLNPREAAAAAAAKRLNLAASALEGSSSEQQQDPAEKVNGDVANNVLRDDQPGSSVKGSESQNISASVSQSMLSDLMDMGFSRNRAVRALEATDSSSLENAIDWCFDHADDPSADEPLPEEDTAATDASVMSKEEKASQLTLSAEEREERANELLRKAREKRISEEKAAEVEREKNRVRSGKEITASKAAHEEQQRKRLIEQRRKEKLEALEERRRIRENIAADREARHTKFNMPASEPSVNGPGTEAPGPTMDNSSATASSSVAKPSASAGKIQFRLPDGSRLEKAFSAGDTVGDAAVYIAQSKPELAAAGFKLSQQYPKRVFSSADMSMTLADADLFPRGALIVSLLK